MTEDMIWDNVTTAVAASDLPAIERCLSEGFEVNRLIIGDKWNLLHLHLVREGRPVSPAVVKRLIDAGINVNAADHLGWTPLHFAARTGSTEAVQLLLDAAARVNVQDNKGITPLHRAFISHNPCILPLVEALLKYGADPDVPNKGSSARIYTDRAVFTNIKELRQLLAKYPPKRGSPG